jgi:hypothetical protein
MATTGAMASNDANMVHLYPNLSTTNPVKKSPTTCPTFVICLRIVCCPALNVSSIGPASYLILYLPDGSRSPYLRANSGNPKRPPINE